MTRTAAPTPIRSATGPAAPTAIGISHGITSPTAAATHIAARATTTHTSARATDARTVTRIADAGFTLIESLVALTVLALTAVALLGATQAHVARIGSLESRAAAGWALENHLAEASLGLAPAPGPVPLLGIGVYISALSTATTDPDLMRLDLTASLGADNAPLARLTGFVLAPTTGNAP